MEKEVAKAKDFYSTMKEMEFKKEKKNDVFVLNKNGEEEDNTTRKRARILTERGEAKIVKYVPFTIQLLKEMGENSQAQIVVSKGTIHACLSSIGQNRTEFLLHQAIKFSQQGQKVVFVSSIVNDKILNEMIEQEVHSLNGFAVDRFTALTVSVMNPVKLENLIAEFEPTIMVVDDWDEEKTMVKIAKRLGISVLYGISMNRNYGGDFYTKQKVNRMPQISDIRNTPHEQETSSVVGLFANQVCILKNRSGDMINKATHIQNIDFHFTNK